MKICVFKSVLSLRSENAGPVTRDHIKSSHMRSETTLQLERLFLHPGTAIMFLCLEAKFISVFQSPWLAVNFEICNVKLTLMIEF